VFFVGLQCGIEGAYLTKAQGASAYAGSFAALCDLREIVPYGFGYMMSAKVGTGIVAELGAMRISDEIDALEVMGFDSVLSCARRSCWPHGWCCRSSTWRLSPPASSPAIWRSWSRWVMVSSGGYSLIFWMFQNPPDLLSA